MSHPRSFTPPLDTRFISVNGTLGPAIDGRPLKHEGEFNGAYQGGPGDEQFLVSESNYTRNTTLPSWVDDSAMYMPFISGQEHDSGQIYKAQTRYFRAVANCKPLEFGTDYQLKFWNNITRYIDIGSPDDEITANSTYKPDSVFKVKVASDDGTVSSCFAPRRHTEPFTRNLGQTDRPLGKLAVELLTTLIPAWNASQEEAALCRSAVTLGWVRVTQVEDREDWKGWPTDINEDASANNTMMMVCQPNLTTGTARINVNTRGVLLNSPELSPEPDQSATAINKYFPNGVGDFIAHSNLFLFRTLHANWHTDRFASEFFHYFVNRAAGDVHLTDPNTPLPTFADVEQHVNKAYSRLFAIWLGVNKELVFEPANDLTSKIEGFTIVQEDRLFFTIPLFIISEIILSIYLVVSIVVYIRRPGRYLPRLPTYLAAVFAMFAPSSAIKDLRGTSQMTNKEREKFLTDLACRYGYGSYIGSDGAVHVGIEKVPYVRYMKDVKFVGSGVERGMRTGKEEARSTTTAKTEYMHVSLEEVEEERVDASPVTRTVAIAQGPRIEYTAIGTYDEEDERSVSPLEETSLNTNEAQLQGRPG